MPDTATVAPKTGIGGADSPGEAGVKTLARDERDPAADLARWPVDHLRDCPALTDPAHERQVVEFYRDRRILTKKPLHDVSDDQRPSVAIMVAHCTLCGGITYHDL